MTSDPDNRLRGPVTTHFVDGWALTGEELWNPDPSANLDTLRLHMPDRLELDVEEEVGRRTLVFTGVVRLELEEEGYPEAPDDTWIDCIPEIWVNDVPFSDGQPAYALNTLTGQLVFAGFPAPGRWPDRDDDQPATAPVRPELRRGVNRRRLWAESIRDWFDNTSDRVLSVVSQLVSPTTSSPSEQPSSQGDDATEPAHRRPLESRSLEPSAPGWALTNGEIWNPTRPARLRAIRMALPYRMVLEVEDEDAGPRTIAFSDIIELELHHNRETDQPPAAPVACTPTMLNGTTPRPDGRPVYHLEMTTGSLTFAGFPAPEESSDRTLRGYPRPAADTNPPG